MQYQDQHLTVFESGLYRTTTTVISTPKFNLLVDPNWLPGEIKVIQEYLASLGDKPLILLFTHSDYDHILGYRAFKAHLVIASQAFVNSPDKEKNLQLIRDFDDKYYIKRDYPIAYPHVDIVIREDGQDLTLGDCRFSFYLAPGHTADGLFTVVEPYGYFIAGDYLCNVEFPFIYDSSAAYLNTLRKADVILEKHRIERMIPGHGDLALDAAEVKRRVVVSASYVQELRESVWNRRPFDLPKWLSRYDFPQGLTEAHHANEALVKKEMLADGA